MRAYDSAEDTAIHIRTVQHLMTVVCEHLEFRLSNHDLSKLQEPEKSIFDEFTPKLRALTYGSDEYKAYLEQMGVALNHHYEHNSHHPEHYENGINGMSLLDLIEMLSDWKAAGQRHADGNMVRSLEINRERFGMSDQLYEIFLNTVRELDW